MSLSEMEIVTRVRGVDKWMRAIAKHYHLLSDRSQLLINHFLNLDCLVNNEKYEDVIQDLLKAGNVLGEGDNARSLSSTQRDTLAHIDGVSEDHNLLKKPIDDDLAAAALNSNTREAEWMVIGKTNGENPPKGCCVVS